MERTDEEIIERIKLLGPSDAFGWETNDLGGYISFFAAERGGLLRELTPEERERAISEWKTFPRDELSIIGEIREYMPFAWEKARNKRGLSATRSIGHFRQWLWMIGNDELLAFAQNTGNYGDYGEPILRAISERYGCEIPAGS